MKLLAISGSARRESTNTAFLMAMRDFLPTGVELSVFARLDALPVFSPDAEGVNTPLPVAEFLELVSSADGIIISSPEYVRAIPGGLKNAIDWLVSRFEVIGKPIAIAHASHRGDDMLASLRLVLSTISTGFLESAFLRAPLIGKSPAEIMTLLRSPYYESEVSAFLADFAASIRLTQGQALLDT
ncbi:NADPH-dependent FMN reductase [Burkholderia sp. Ax-1719]|uniref:NADPH-dependent FMN reductase n=1 Tax=Burkholderia sp. Ax-1719 TaxID=2608334 RepID=UPI0014204764|nr:NADPH-dependent FMN reductase [Burkholderia sp. Ax-1719]NIE63203.1 NAD(P)H-dependent oxidoreductase [Burkholderia sp. Ax-1719]